MSATVDEKKRIVIQGDVQKGDEFHIHSLGSGHFLLQRLVRAQRPPQRSLEELRALIRSSKVKMDVSWEELRQMTREP